jgi:uncharacterized coiled-coil protein SlyX
MTEESSPKLEVDLKEDPISELRKIVNEQNAVILKQNEAIKSLTARMNESEKAAAASPAVSQAQQEKPEESPQDRAWKAMMAEFNIKEE